MVTVALKRWACAFAPLVGCALGCGGRDALPTGAHGSGAAEPEPAGAGAAPGTGGSGVGAGGTSATSGSRSLCHIGAGGGLPTSGCQDDAGPATAGGSASTGIEPPNGASWHIEGSVDGGALYYEGDNLFQASTRLSRYRMGGAHLWLFADWEAALRLPFSEGAGFVCFDVETERAGAVMSFSSGELSRLACDSEEQKALHLYFGQGGESFLLDHLGTTAELYSSAGFCDASGCELEFGDRENGTWVLWLDTWVAPGGSAAFTRSALAHSHGSFRGACGGGGTITVSEDYWVEVAIDALGPLQTCPGEPVAGALQGLVPHPISPY